MLCSLWKFLRSRFFNMPSTRKIDLIVVNIYVGFITCNQEVFDVSCDT